MKRFLSLFIAVVMVASMCVISAPMAAAATLDAHNVGVEVPHFSGSLYFNEIVGRATRANGIAEVYEEDVLLKEGTGSSVITLDGVIDEGEWGIPLLSIDSDYAAQMKTSTPSAENTYYWHGAENVNGLKLDQGLHFDFWMAWDADYLYIAAVADDPDGPRLDKENEDVWNGDCLQIRVDPDGPNSVVNGKGYDASKIAFPWGSAVRGGEDPSAEGATEVNGGKVINLGAAYASPNSSSGHVALFDMSPRYNPHREAVYLADGTVAYYRTAYDQRDAGFASDARGSLGDNPFGAIFGAVRPVSSATADNANRFVTTYELAIPWTQVSGSMYDYNYNEETGEETSTLILSDYIPAIGDEFGISVALLNGAYVGGNGEYNSWLTWGSGICKAQMGTDDGTAGGSNSMVLSATELGAANCEHTFAEATCIAPETCTICGYQRGFATGHDYTCEVKAVPSETQDGLIVGTCKTCGYVHNAVIAKENPAVSHTWSGAANDRQWKAYEYAYVDENGDYIYNDDGSNKTNLVQYEGENVLSFVDGDPGTYFQLEDNFSTHSYKYDFRLTGLDDTNGGYALEDIDTHYTTGFYHWFGGTANNGSQIVYGMNYAAGFFPDSPTSTTGKFMIREAGGGVVNDSDQKILAESAIIDLGTDWHKIVYLFDNESDTCMLFCDDQLMCGTWNEGFDLGAGAGNAYDLVRRFNTSCMIKGMEIGNKTAFLGATAPANGTVTIDGVEYGSFAEGETVELPVPALYEAEANYFRFFTYTSNEVEVVRSAYSADNGTANGRTYSFVMPAGDVTLTAEYVLVGDVIMDGVVGTRDFKQLNKVLLDTVTINEKEAEAADIQLDGTIGTRDVKALTKVNLGLTTITQ